VKFLSVRIIFCPIIYRQSSSYRCYLE